MAILHPLQIQEEGIEKSRFLLAQLTGQRAKMLIRGAKPLVDSAYTKPITVALEEIHAGKVLRYDEEEATAIREAVEQRMKEKQDAEIKAIREKESSRAKASQKKEEDE